MGGNGKTTRGRSQHLCKEWHDRAAGVTRRCTSVSTPRLSFAVEPSCERDSDAPAVLPSAERKSDGAVAGTGKQKYNPRISKAPKYVFRQDLNFFLQKQRSRRRGEKKRARRRRTLVRRLREGAGGAGRNVKASAQDATRHARSVRQRSGLGVGLAGRRSASAVAAELVLT